MGAKAQNSHEMAPAVLQGKELAAAWGSARRASISLGKGQLRSGELLIAAGRALKLSFVLPACTHRLLARYSGLYLGMKMVCAGFSNGI